MPTHKRDVYFTLAKTFAFFILVAFCTEVSALTIKDRRGVSNTIGSPVKRAVFHINYEFIPALGVWERVVGLGGTAYTNDLVLATIPAHARIPVIGDVKKINIEQILRVKPEALITWSYNRDELDFVEQKGKTPVIAYYPYNLEEFYDMFNNIGALMGKRHRARKVINEMEGIFGMIKSRSAQIPENRRKKILWIGDKPTMVAGKLDPKNDVIEMVGGRNPAAVLMKHAGEVSLEQVFYWNPDVLFIVWHAPYLPADIFKNHQWRHVSAVRNKQIYKAPPWSTWSPRLAPIALWMAARTYPDLYRDVALDNVFNDFFQEVFNIPYQSVEKIEY